jgi:hypothetical protein
MADFNCQLKERIRGIVAGHVRYQALSPLAGNDPLSHMDDGVVLHVSGVIPQIGLTQNGRRCTVARPCAEWRVTDEYQARCAGHTVKAFRGEPGLL